MEKTRKKAPKWPSSLTETRLPVEAPSRSKVWKLICAADIAPQQVKWLWYPYIPAGRVTSIEGDPGIGKSWIIAAIAAAVSRGDPLPGQQGQMHKPGRVLMMSAEDGLADTMIPRLMSLDAKRENIFFPAARFTLDADGIKGLEATMHDAKAAILFVDPVQLFMGSKVDMNKANEVRGFMDGLHVVAERTGAAVVIVRHLRKGGGQAIYRGLGSIDFTAAVRSILQVYVNDEGQKFVQHEKCNNAPLGPTLSYTMGDNKFTWGQVTDRVGTGGAPVSTTTKKVADARKFLLHLLASGPMLATLVQEEAEVAGIAETTLKRAKSGFVQSLKNGSGSWYWALMDYKGPLPDA